MSAPQERTPAPGKPHPLVVRLDLERRRLLVRGLAWQVERLLAEAERLGLLIEVDQRGLC